VSAPTAIRPGASLAGRVLIHVQVAILLVVIVAPLAWMALASFKTRVDVTRYPPTLIFEPTLENYRQLFQRTDFLDNTLNSFIVASGSTLLGLANPGAGSTDSPIR